MKRVIYSIIVVVLILSLNSCKDDFSPFGEYRERYVLYSILHGDSTNQVVMVGRSFGGGTFDPANDVNDHTIEGAYVRVWQEDSVYIFRDTLMSVGNDLLRHVYYSNEFSIDNDELYEIEVLLPNGRRLNSSTISPAILSMDLQESDFTIPPNSYSDIIELKWDSDDIGNYFQTQLYFKYEFEENGNTVTKTKEIPIKYLQDGDDYIPVYSRPAPTQAAIYELDAIERALKEISEGVADKSKFLIHQDLVLKISTMDINISRYTSSTSRAFDDLTVRVNELDYTNIEGGLGLFGSFIVKNYGLRFEQFYIQQFGYDLIFD